MVTLKPRLLSFLMALFLALIGSRWVKWSAPGVGVTFAVREHVPDGCEDGMFEGHGGFHGSAAGGDAPVFCGQVGVLAPGSGQGCDAQGAFEVIVAGQDVC